MLKEIYRKYLFAHNYLVGEKTEDYKDAMYYNYALASMFGIKVTAGVFNVNKQCVEDASTFIGQNVPEAFYKGFPQSVLKLTPVELLVDQLISYLDTYGLDNWDAAQHSRFEENLERVAFHERTEIKKFECVTEESAVQLLADYVEDLLQATRPLNKDMYLFVTSYIADYNYKVKNIRSKNTAIKLLIDTRDTQYAKFIGLNDVLKVAETIQYNTDMEEYKKTWRMDKHSLKNLNLKNQNRKFIAKLINLTCKGDEIDVFEKRQDWCGLLHHIHFKPTTHNAQLFTNAIRNKEGRSVYSYTEKLIEEGNPHLAAAMLANAKGSGAVLRNLDYYITRCKNKAQIERVLELAVSDNPIINIQLYLKYMQYDPSQTARTFAFTKNNMAKVHIETPDEVAHRKSILNFEQALACKEAIKANIHGIYKDTLGKVYIDPSFKNMALPLNQSVGNFDFGTMTTGSVIDIPAGKKIRCFTYWEKVNDIDLSCMGLKANGDTVEFSWRTMYDRQSSAVCYSGDQTSGYSGGSEYFDVDIDRVRKTYPDLRYMIFNNNVFSGITFSGCICRAGYMMRDINDSGEVFEPKTVQTAYTINCDSTYAHLFALDIINRKIIWLNVSQDSMRRVGACGNYKYLTKYFDLTKYINVYDLFKMKATEVVDDPCQADIVVSDDKTLILDQDKQIQITSRDQEKIMRYMENLL